MLNVTTSALVYLAELLISFLFFSHLAEKKKPTVIVLLVGCCIFGVGVWINLFFHNTVWLNLLYFFAENLLFSFFLFDIRFTVAAFYSILIGCLFNGAGICLYLYHVCIFWDQRHGLQLQSDRLYSLRLLSAKPSIFCPA